MEEERGWIRKGEELLFRTLERISADCVDVQGITRVPQRREKGALAVRRASSNSEYGALYHESFSQTRRYKDPFAVEEMRNLRFSQLLLVVSHLYLRLS